MPAALELATAEDVLPETSGGASADVARRVSEEQTRFRLADAPGHTPFQTHSRLSSLLKAGLTVIAALVLRLYLLVYHRLRIVGAEHLPLGQSFVMVANHTSHLDMFCLLAALPVGIRSRAFPAIARDYFCERPVLAFLAHWMINGLPFNRRAAHEESLRNCEHVLACPGNILVLFPEGTRSVDGELAEFRPGVAFLTAGRGLPVVPCHIAGTHVAWPKGRWLPRPTAVRLRIGTPRDYADLPRTKEGRQQVCRDLHEAVWLLKLRSELPVSVSTSVSTAT